MKFLKERKKVIIDQIIEYLQSLPGGTVTSVHEILNSVCPNQEKLQEKLGCSLKFLKDLTRHAKKKDILLDLSDHDGRSAEVSGNLVFPVYHKKPGKRCPFCGSYDTADILYGMPSHTQVLDEDIKNHRIELGKCDISLQSPKYHCFSCKENFSKYIVTHNKAGRKAYDDSIVEIRFQRGGLFEGRKVIKVSKIEGRYIVTYLSFPEFEGEKTKELTEKEWNALLKRLFKKLHIDEWKREYYNWDILDGEQWSLDIKREGRRAKSINGSNEYPPYWEECEKTFDALIKKM